MFLMTTGLGTAIPFRFSVGFLKIKRKLIALTVLQCLIKIILEQKNGTIRITLSKKQEPE